MKVAVIGSGLGGFASALMLRDAGHTVEIVTLGRGGLLLSPGTLDVYGWDEDDAAVSDSFAAITKIKNPNHPYAKIGEEAVREGINWLKEKTELFADTGEGNVLIPTAIGAIRPTAAVQHTMKDAIVEDGKKFLVVGIKQFRDFPAALIADNLARTEMAKIEARSMVIDLAPRAPEADSTGTTFARAFDGTAGLDGPATRKALVEALRGQAKGGETILLPAILGFAPEVFDELREAIGAPIAEVPTPPPAIAGRRINDALLEATRAARIDISLNATAVGFLSEGNRITALRVQRAGRITNSKVDAVVYAGGGLEFGSIMRDSFGKIRERIFDLPVMLPGGVVQDNPDESNIQKVDMFGAGLEVDEQMRPLDGGKVAFENLYCAGSIIGGAKPWAEKSGEGIALGSAVALTRAIGKKD